MDKLLNELKTPEALERWRRHIENQFLKRELARLIEKAQPDPTTVETPQAQPLPTE